jgi:hypothetical protein
MPVNTVTFTARAGGTLSGATTQGGTVHTQIFNAGVNTRTAVTAALTEIGEAITGWFITGTETRLAAGTRYDDFLVASISADGLTIELAEISGDDIGVEARFELVSYVLAYTARAGGRIAVITDADSTVFAPGDTSRHTVTHGLPGPRVRALPNLGFNFVRWTDQHRDSATAVRVDTAWGGDTVAAIFVSDSVTLTYDVIGMGRLRVNESSSAAPLPFELRLPVGATGPSIQAVPLAAPNHNWHFVMWSDSVTDNPRVDASLTEDVRVYAIFAINTFARTYIAGPGGKVAAGIWETTDDGGDDNGDTADAITESPVLADTLVVRVPYNATDTLVWITAIPDSGFRFVRWSDDVTTPIRSDSSITANSTVSAIFEATSIAVAEGSREIQTGGTRTEIAIATPAMVTATGELTAGPNPAARQTGGISLFWTGGALRDGRLAVYDINGNFVTNINVNDGSAVGNDSNNGRRVVGVWNLTDRNGRPVSDGTYLIKGGLTAKSGRTERISIVVGVR